MAGPSRTAHTLAHDARRLSRRPILSYIVDWIIIVGVALLGGGFAKLSGNKHAFSLDDLSISYPHKPRETMPFPELVVVVLIGPGLITFVLSMLLIPGPTADPHTPKALIWRRKLWEWNTAWMGLGVALAGAFSLTEGLKDLAGKPRPDILARCDPDLSPASLTRYQVGGLRRSLSRGKYGRRLAYMPQQRQISRQRWLCILAVGALQFQLGGDVVSQSLAVLEAEHLRTISGTCALLQKHPLSFDNENALGRSKDQASASADAGNDRSIPGRNQAAAPPVYLLLIALAPPGVASFVCVSRYADYRHTGFDIISGAVLGALFAYLGFKWCHLPIRRGAGWSWGARSRDRAIFVGVRTSSYMGNEGWESTKATKRLRPHDIESQEGIVTAAGMEVQREWNGLGSRPSQETPGSSCSKGQSTGVT